MPPLLAEVQVHAAVEDFRSPGLVFDFLVFGREPDAFAELIGRRHAAESVVDPSNHGEIVASISEAKLEHKLWRSPASSTGRATLWTWHHAGVCGALVVLRRQRRIVPNWTPNDGVTQGGLPPLSLQ